MADQRTMAELLRAPTEGYVEAIVVPLILVEKFELKHRVARWWLEKEPPRSILTWEDLVSNFINEFFPLSRTTNLRNEISNVQQRFDESFHEAWDRYKDLLCASPHHDFTELHQLYTFYNALNPANPYSLNSAVGCNLLERRTQDVLTIIENKSKQLSVVTTAMIAILNNLKQPHLQFLDNIHGYVAAAVVNYNHGNSGYRPLGSGSLPSNTIANPKGEFKAITTRSGIVLDRPSIPIPPSFINPEEDERVEETLTDQDLAEYTIKVPPPLKMLKALLSKKEKLQELANIPLNENYSAVILKKLPEKLGDPRKFLIPCGFSELKCKALADLGARINLMPLSVWKKLGLPKFISTRMTIELANRAICTPAGIARDVFVPVGMFTFPADFVIVDYERDPRVYLILGRPFLRTGHALIDEFADELALITFLIGNNDIPLDIKYNLKEIEYLLHYDPIKDIDSILEDLIDQSNLVDLNDNLVDTMPELFTNEHALNYSFPLLYDEYDDDLFEVQSDTKYVYNDPFDSKGEKIKESKLLIDELDLSSDFLPSFEYDSFSSEDFSKNLSETITRVAPDKKMAIFHASLILEDFDPPLNELPSFKEVPGVETPLSFTSKNEGKVFKPRILTSKEVHFSLILELSHQGYNVFKINQILKSPMKIFLFSCG
nr:DNA-directed DNA polymerase [Tanacetum cinerariifolium]